MTPASAASVYASIARLANQAQSGTGLDKTATAGGDFGGMVREAVGSMVESGKAAEKGAVAMAEGRADMVNVVTAMAETEVALETMVSIRDRVISAYEEIMRMPI
jgi:flagellar hook-basal body complex protein FliE